VLKLSFLEGSFRRKKNIMLETSKKGTAFASASTIFDQQGAPETSVSLLNGKERKKVTAGGKKTAGV